MRIGLVHAAAHDRGRRLIGIVGRVYYRPQSGGVGLHTAGKFDIYNCFVSYYDQLLLFLFDLGVIKCGLLTWSGTDAESDLTSRNIPLSLVAALLKKFLRELPDSVIPEQSYQDFLCATSESARCIVDD